MSECETNIHAPPVETAEVSSRCSGPVNVRYEIKSITRHGIMRFQTSSPLGQSTVIPTTERLSSHEITCVCFRLSGRATKDSNNVFSMITLLPFKQVDLTCICQICKKESKVYIYIEREQSYKVHNWRTTEWLSGCQFKVLYVKTRLFQMATILK